MFDETIYKIIKERERLNSSFSQETRISVLRSNILKYGDITCEYCKKVIEPKEVVFDHKVPLTKGGNHNQENALVCCFKCNACKHAKDYEEIMFRCSGCKKK
jgi:5-methylcytosine-specific restriction endonuclease McrA